MATNRNTSDFFGFGMPRDRQRPGADDPEAAFYGMMGQGQGQGEQPAHWVDADGTPDPHEGMLSPFSFAYRTPVRQKRRHALLPWLVVAALLLLALPILKVALTVFAIVSVAIVLLLGFGVVMLVLALFVSMFLFARRVRSLSDRMYM